MKSTRLPCKMMKTILGKPLIWHIINRLKSIKSLSNVVIATTSDKSDKPIRQFAELENIPYYAGSQNNILDRLYQTGKKFETNTIIKVNGDCPLIDPEIIEIGLKKYYSYSKKPNMLTNSFPSTYPVGLQYVIFNFKTLLRIWENLHDSFWQENIVMYILENKNQFLTVNMENNTDLSSLKWTVDYKEDLEFVRVVYKNLFTKNNFFNMQDILSLLKQKPEIQKINSKYSSNEGVQLYSKLKNEHINQKNTSNF